jgi:hypothetical protein
VLILGPVKREIPEIEVSLMTDEMDHKGIYGKEKDEEEDEPVIDFCAHNAILFS